MKKSVVIATYNGAEFLREQLDTIRMQTVKPDEVVICDDCSTDNTVEVARTYIEEYGLNGSWIVYENDSNLGYANNFNKAAKLATGDLLFFSDQDDTWDKEKIQIMSELMEQYEDCAVLSTDYNPWYFGDTEKKAPKEVLEKMPNNGKLEKINLSKTSFYIGAIGCCMCVRKTFFDGVNDYWHDGWAQDDRMWRLSQCADGCYILHSNLINHRIHSNNTSTYSKYHTLSRRVKLFKEMQQANEEMLKTLMDRFNNSETPDVKRAILPQIKIVNKHISMMELRIKLLEKRNLFCSIPLVFYLSFYEKKKSYLLEAYMALKGK